MNNRVIKALSIALLVGAPVFIGCGKSKNPTPVATSLDSTLGALRVQGPLDATATIVTQPLVAGRAAERTLRLTSGRAMNNLITVSPAAWTAIPLQNLEHATYSFVQQQSLGYPAGAPLLLLEVDLLGDGTKLDTLVFEPAYFTYQMGEAGHFGALAMPRDISPGMNTPLNRILSVTVRAASPNDIAYSWQNIALPGSTLRNNGGQAVPANMKNVADVVRRFPRAKLVKVSVAVGSKDDTNTANKTTHLRSFGIKLRGQVIQNLAF